MSSAVKNFNFKSSGTKKKILRSSSDSDMSEEEETKTKQPKARRSAKDAFESEAGVDGDASDDEVELEDDSNNSFIKSDGESESGDSGNESDDSRNSKRAHETSAAILKLARDLCLKSVRFVGSPNADECVAELGNGKNYLKVMRYANNSKANYIEELAGNSKDTPQDTVFQCLAILHFFVDDCGAVMHANSHHMPYHEVSEFMGKYPEMVPGLKESEYNQRRKEARGSSSSSSSAAAAAAASAAPASSPRAPKALRTLRKGTQDVAVELEDDPIEEVDDELERASPPRRRASPPRSRREPVQASLDAPTDSSEGEEDSDEEDSDAGGARTNSKLTAIELARRFDLASDGIVGYDDALNEALEKIWRRKGLAMGERPYSASSADRFWFEVSRLQEEDLRRYVETADAKAKRNISKGRKRSREKEVQYREERNSSRRRFSKEDIAMPADNEIEKMPKWRTGDDESCEDYSVLDDTGERILWAKVMEAQGWNQFNTTLQTLYSTETELNHRNDPDFTFDKYIRGKAMDLGRMYAAWLKKNYPDKMPQNQETRGGYMVKMYCTEFHAKGMGVMAKNELSKLQNSYARAVGRNRR